VALFYREPEIARPHVFERDDERGTDFAPLLYKFATTMTAFASADYRYRRTTREVHPPRTFGEHRRRPVHVVYPDAQEGGGRRTKPHGLIVVRSHMDLHPRRTSRLGRSCLIGATDWPMRDLPASSSGSAERDERRAGDLCASGQTGDTHCSCHAAFVGSFGYRASRRYENTRDVCLRLNQADMFALSTVTLT
jgi:hypothetical protein